MGRLGFSFGQVYGSRLSGRWIMDEQPMQPAKSALPEPVLKDKRAISLYWIALGALAAVPVLTVMGLLLLAGIGRDVPETIVTLLGTAASTALGGLVGMVATNGSGSGGK